MNWGSRSIVRMVKKIIENEEIRILVTLDSDTKDRLIIIDSCRASRDDYFFDNYCTVFDTCEKCPIYQKNNRSVLR